MKRRILSLIMCFILAVSAIAFTGCADKTDETQDDTSNELADTRALTLTIYTITNESTTDDAVAAVERRLNDITEARFNTHIELRAYTEAEYYDIINQRIEDIEKQNEWNELVAAADKKSGREGKAAGVTTVPSVEEEVETTPPPDETEYDEYGLQKTVYDDADENQMDIFLIPSQDMYNDLKRRELLVSLDDQISINSKILKNYIYPYYFDAVSASGGIFAIPNNHAVGTYTYMLLRRELIDKYYFDVNSIETVLDLDSYFSAVEKYDTEYVPLLNKVEPYVDTLSDAPIFGAEVPKTGVEQPLKDEEGELIPGIAPPSYYPQIIFGIWNYRRVASMMVEMEEAGYLQYGDPAEIKCAAAVLKGDCTLPEKYSDDYYVIVDRYPTFTNDEVFNSMYAISSYCSNPNRAMEVLELFTIDEQFRNIFQYGIEGVNYELDEYTNGVRILNDDYSMNPLYTGNQFIMWQNDRMTEAELSLSADNWANAKQQNIDSIKSCFLGFSVQLENDPSEIGQIYVSYDEVGNEYEETFMSVEEFMADIKRLGNEYLQLTDIDDWKAYNAENGKDFDFNRYLLTLSGQLYSNLSVIEASNNEVYDYSIFFQHKRWFNFEMFDTEKINEIIHGTTE